MAACRLPLVLQQCRVSMNVGMNLWWPRAVLRDAAALLWMDAEVLEQRVEQ